MAPVWTGWINPPPILEGRHDQAGEQAEDDKLQLGQVHRGVEDFSACTFCRVDGRILNYFYIDSKVLMVLTFVRVCYQ